MAGAVTPDRSRARRRAADTLTFDAQPPSGAEPSVTGVKRKRVTSAP